MEVKPGEIWEICQPDRLFLVTQYRAQEETIDKVSQMTRQPADSDGRKHFLWQPTGF